MEILFKNDEQLSQEILQIKEEIDKFVANTREHHISDQLIDRLIQLKEDLPDHPEIWIYTNFHAALNPEVFIKTARNSFRKTSKFWWLDGLDIARNVLILFPIMLTWLAVSNAAIAYASAVAEKPDLANMPLLALWQSDFDAKLQPFLGFISMRLSDVAMLDFILILLIIGLSGAVHYFRDHYQEKLEKAVMSLAEDLNALLWRLDRIFVIFRKHRHEDAEQRAMALLINIDQYVEKVNQQAIAQFQSIAQEEKRLMEQAKETQEQHYQKQLGLLNALGIEHQKAIRQTNEQVNTLISRQQAAFGEWVTRLQSVTDELTNCVQIINQKQGELTAALADQQRNLFASAESHLNKIDQQQEAQLKQIANAQRSLEQQGEQLKKAANDLCEMASTFRRGVDDAEGFVSSLNQSINSLGQSLANLADDTSEMNTAQNRMIDALQSLEGMIAVFEKVTGGLTIELRASAESLANSASQNGAQLDAFRAAAEQLGVAKQILIDCISAMNAAMQQNIQNQYSLKEELAATSSALDAVNQGTQTILPFLPVLQTTASALQESLSTQSAVQREALQENRADRAARDELALLIQNINSSLTAVSKELKEIIPLVHQFEMVSTQLNEKTSWGADRQSGQANLQVRIANLEGRIEEIPHNGGNGNENVSGYLNRPAEDESHEPDGRDS